MTIVSGSIRPTDASHRLSRRARAPGSARWTRRRSARRIASFRRSRSRARPASTQPRAASARRTPRARCRPRTLVRRPSPWSASQLAKAFAASQRRTGRDSDGHAGSTHRASASPFRRAPGRAGSPLAAPPSRTPSKKGPERPGLRRPATRRFGRPFEHAQRGFRRPPLFRQHRHGEALPPLEARPVHQDAGAQERRQRVPRVQALARPGRREGRGVLRSRRARTSSRKSIEAAVGQWCESVTETPSGVSVATRGKWRQADGHGVLAEPAVDRAEARPLALEEDAAARGVAPQDDPRAVRQPRGRPEALAGDRGAKRAGSHRGAQARPPPGPRPGSASPTSSRHRRCGSGSRRGSRARGRAARRSRPRGGALQPARRARPRARPSRRCGSRERPRARGRGGATSAAARGRRACRPRSSPPRLEVEREGGVDRHRGERLLERQAHREAAERHREGQRRREAAARVHVGGERDRRAGLDQRPRRREAAEAQVEGRGRAAASRRSAARRAPPSRPRETNTRWSAERAPSSPASSRPAGRRQLVGVDAQLQPVLARREQDAPALLDGEDAPLAEDVGEDGEAALGDLGDHLLDQEVDVAARGRRGARAAPRARPGRSARRVTGWRSAARRIASRLRISAAVSRP